MILDMFSEEDIKVVVSYLPVWEFFFSMHVLSNPEIGNQRSGSVEASTNHVESRSCS